MRNATVTPELVAAVLAALAEQGVAVVPPTEAAPTAPAKTEPKPKAYRSAKGKEQAKADVAALWARTLKAAGAKKRAQLTDKQFAAYQAEAKAIWAAVPKTRTTKA